MNYPPRLVVRFRRIPWIENTSLASNPQFLSHPHGFDSHSNTYGDRFYDLHYAIHCLSSCHDFLDRLVAQIAQIMHALQ